jgi:hypothetical protein
MSATFETKINAIRTTTVGEMTNVIRKVEFTVKGTEEGQSFELPQTVDLADPDSANFVQLASVTEADVVAWVETAFANINGVKAHIQFVLDKEVAKNALTSTPMPWAPVPEAPAEPTPTE